MKKLLCAAAIVLLSYAIVFAIATIMAVTLADGRDDVNKIGAPIFDALAVQPLAFTITQTFDRSAKIVRKGATNMFTKGPEYNLDKSVDLASLFGDALRTEASAMGFRVASGADAAWMIDGTIKDIYLESKQIPYGATLFYGYMDLELQVRQGAEPRQARRIRFHNFMGRYNAGMGRRDEASEALAHLIVESAQEAVSRLNREFFKAAARPEVTARMAVGVEGRKNDLYLVGLAGSTDASRSLIALLPKVTDEGRRAEVIDALARIGSADAVQSLAERYATEDEDCRWYTLKAMDYIGGAEALALVKGQGVKDTDGGPRRLAQRIAAAP